MASLIRILESAFSGGPIYVRFGRHRLRVRNVQTEIEFDDEPLVGLSASSGQTFGRAARSRASTVVNPFSHDRVVLEDFDLAEKLLRHTFAAVSGTHPFRASPIAVMHPTDSLQGGLSKIERRALLELAQSAGARKAYVWEGRELTDRELREGLYAAARKNS